MWFVSVSVSSCKKKQWEKDVFYFWGDFFPILLPIFTLLNTDWNLFEESCVPMCLCVLHKFHTPDTVNFLRLFGEYKIKSYKVDPQWVQRRNKQPEKKKINKQMNMKIWIHFVGFKTIGKEHWIGSAAKKKEESKRCSQMENCEIKKIVESFS